MINKTKKRVRRMGRARTETKWRLLARRIRRLGRACNSPDEVPKRVESYTAIDNQSAIDSEALVNEIEADGENALVKPKEQRNRLEAKLKPDRRTERWARERLERAEKHFLEFVSRFPHAVEQLAKVHASGWKFLVLVTLALLTDAALNYLAMSYIAPNLGTTTALPGIVLWLLGNMALISTVGITVAAGVMTKNAGREAAWGLNPLVRGPTDLDVGELVSTESEGSATEGAQIPAVVYSDRARRSHRVAFGVLVTALVGLVVGLVILREPALGLLGSMAGGSDVGGIAGSDASQESSGGIRLTIGLFVVSAFPLLAAGYVSFLRESPLPNRLAALTDDVVDARKALIAAMTTRGASEVEIANVGITMNVIRTETRTNAVLARLMPHMGHEIMVEALPELFGIASTGPNAFQWSADKLASEQPNAGEVEQERLSAEAEPDAERPAAPPESTEYDAPPEVAPHSNGAQSEATATPPEGS